MMGGGNQILPKDTVTFNVGGKIFQTTSTTLANAGRNSFFGPLFDDDWNLSVWDSDNNGENSIGKLKTHDQIIFIDRNPDCFGVLLDLLRTGELYIPAGLPEKRVFREAQFYGLSDHVRGAKWGPFEGNCLRQTASVAGRAPGDGTAIRAGPDGGCCVAHGCIVHVYDWMLEEHPPLNLDYQIVNDVGWLDANHVVVSTCERLGRGDGGMGLFNAANGELRHKFQVQHDNQVKSFTAGALAFSTKSGTELESCSKMIYCSCKGRSNEYGVGVWDQETGQQVDFFYEPLGWSLGDADRLQWLPATNCLLVATLFPRKDNCYISLLDFRAKSMVWSWSDNSILVDEKRVRDAIAMEDSSSICVVNEFEDLGFIDLRSTASSVRWSSRSRLVKANHRTGEDDEPCYPKLAFHNSQLFSSMNDSISVFSGPDWVLTSRLSHPYGGPICDFSIAGDRLFALHSELNIFDVWEAPPSPPFF